MTEFEALVGLNQVEGLGSIRLNRLLEYYGKPQHILSADPEGLSRVLGIGNKIAQGIRSLRQQDIDREIAGAAKDNISILTQGSADYPENLKNIPDPPIVLYVKGRLRQEDRLSIAVVGSRRASYYGLSCAEKFSSQLAESGFCVVSGMARGIDTCAHKGALSRNGSTIAVLGSGLKRIYPSENMALAEEISANGAVVSEFPLDTQPLKQNFPRRNRVISGMSLGVLVIEAARNSGALITADFALEQGREVFALPGKIDSETSFGANELIKQGARLVSGVDDILEELNLEFLKQGCPATRLEDERLDSPLRRAIADEPSSIDEIIERSGLPAASVARQLLELEMKRVIRQLPGKLFVRNSHEQ